ncbi:hypothetical protein [Aliarcobacter butzleri]|uniref:hypothetical protein n=1 Tax=Aliarcobacter butzleri TaxID=28197 RepID=UPI003AF9BD5F
MSSISIFIHGIGSDKKVWKNFLKRKKEDNETKKYNEYILNNTTIENEQYYYFLYEYKSKKFSSIFGSSWIKTKFIGISDPGDITIDSHSETLRYFLKDEIIPNFDNIYIVAHSMGGILTVNALLKFIENGEKNCLKKISSCILYGSPLKGSDDPSYLESIFNNKISSNILKELKPHSTTINNLLTNLDKNSSFLKKELDIFFINGDADPRIIDIDEKFINKFGIFKQIAGGHSEIVTPKNISDVSFTSYKNILLNKEKELKIKIFQSNSNFNILGEKLLETYILKKIKLFSSESNSLQTLKKEIFVNMFSMLNNGKEVDIDNNLLFLADLCKENKTKFLVSNYGMGKSTIAKQLFIYLNENTDKKAIFINLHLKQLNHYYKENNEDGFFNKILTSKIFEEILKEIADRTILEEVRTEIFKYYFKLLVDGKLVIIFDGLDEVIIDNKYSHNNVYLKNVELDGFIDTLCNSNYSVFITCRKEYSPFFSSFKFLKNKSETYEIELLDWNEKQWNIYISSLEKDTHKNLSQFREDIINYKYADLPKRPLFLSMLTELIIYNNDKISNINPELKINLAEIYNKYIDFCLNNDVQNKIQEVKYEIINDEYYKNAWKNLLIELAYREYKDNRRITINQVKSIAKNLDKDERYYEDKIIESTLESSSLFSIIQREQMTNYIGFSHKSFLEYLVAQKLAKDIFCSDIKNAKCNETWKLYQTIEIHHHFMSEVVRIAFYNGIINSNDGNLNFTQLYENEFIENAFEKLLKYYEIRKKAETDIFLTLHEDYQAVLYYIGKFKINKLKPYLDNIIRNSEEYHPIFFRTVSLSLSSLEDDTSYCDNYVIKIIENYLTGDGSLFLENQNIQKKYHGSNPIKLRKRLENNLNKFLNTDEIISNISLIILANYTTFSVNEDEIIIFTKELNILREVAERRSCDKIEHICRLIPQIWIKSLEIFVHNISE